MWSVAYGVEFTGRVDICSCGVLGGGEMEAHRVDRSGWVTCEVVCGLWCYLWRLVAVVF